MGSHMQKWPMINFYTISPHRKYTRQTQENLSRRGVHADQFGYTYKDPERVYKLSREKVCAPKTRASQFIQSPFRALKHIQLVKRTFDNYEVNIFKVLAILYHRFHVEN